MLAAPVSGALFDVYGARPLYALATAGYAVGACILWFSRQRDEHPQKALSLERT